MSRGPGWLGRAILDLLHLNEYLSSPLLAAKAYAAYSADAPDKAINPTPAQRAAVRRSLSRLQKRGLVVKLGSMYPGERCSYADREHALAILRKDVQHFGLQSLRHYPRRVQGLYADAVQPRALNHKRHTQPLDGQGGSGVWHGFEHLPRTCSRLPFFVTWSISRRAGLTLFAAVLLHFMTRRGS